MKVFPDTKSTNNLLSVTKGRLNPPLFSFGKDTFALSVFNRTEDELKSIMIKDNIKTDCESFEAEEKAVYYRNGAVYYADTFVRGRLIYISPLTLSPKERLIIFYSILYKKA